MDVKYGPPNQNEIECGLLRRNFLTCLKEKSAKDEVPKMNCNVELLLWYNLECPDSYRQFKDNSYFRKTFAEEKAIDNGPNPPKYIKLGVYEK